MLALNDVTTTYGDVAAVDGVSLTVDDGELFCLLGPSGSGKSTALRTIAGFEKPTSGRVVLAGDDVTDAEPYDRDCSMVFQEWALFPSKTVLANVAFGLKMAGLGTPERHERARESLALVEMADYEDAYPRELSGGQRQRVALARSLTVDPDLLLLDEPLSSLDRRLREAMQLELKEIHERLGTTMVYVTHDQDEAFTLADRLGVMRDGELVQVGPPAQVYDDPANQFVESFLGSTNFLSCTVAAVDDRPRLDTPLGVQCRAPVDPNGLAVGDEVTVSLRPERLALAEPTEATPASDADADSETREPPNALQDGGETIATPDVRVHGTVDETVHRGPNVRTHVDVGDADLFVESTSSATPPFDADEDVTLVWDPADARYFDAAGDRLR
ncbi:ABC transporter ATP-binding protein [Halobellus sp. Atlit-31R]|nr:ABC transporter ATP-binding protein [Halobellus sp. Atlit-31R]